MGRFTLILTVLTVLIVLIWGCGPCQKIDTVRKVQKVKEEPKVKEIEVSSYPCDVVVVKESGLISQSWALDVEKAAMQSNCAIVVLWMESPGGYVSDAVLLSHNLALVRKTYGKPIYVYSEYMIASGAYWAAVEADSIFVAPSSWVGSIGVYVERADFTKNDSLSGTFYYYFYGGMYKMQGHPHVKITVEEIQQNMAEIAVIYNDFIVQVGLKRFGQFGKLLKHYGFTNDTSSVLLYSSRMANGKLFSAKDSFASGLVDGVLYFDEFCARLREQGYEIRKLDGTKIETLYK